ncbi:MAG: Lrp/AsnC family transcriptional regulator [Chlorobiota bacterium]|jgi:Lrp/AsnC family leucine-responsive transcriptional regulator|nr:Lrp/AsnC family transcriptional regulator [Chlorobiota bacterium]QQS67741.1 MAG: Lrp/AsnC family transcriptional regulator [Chlorobiota bacterium]
MKLSTDLDNIDIIILSLVQKEGRLPLTIIAEKVGLSTPAASERLKKLEERGVISGYFAKLTGLQLGLDITAFVEVRVDSSSHYKSFIKQVLAKNEILDCHAITGNASHLLKIKTKNTATLEKLLSDIQRWQGVVKSQTSLVLSTHKETLSLPLEFVKETIIDRNK